MKIICQRYAQRVSYEHSLFLELQNLMYFTNRFEFSLIPKPISRRTFEKRCLVVIQVDRSSYFVDIFLTDVSSKTSLKLTKSKFLYLRNYLQINCTQQYCGPLKLVYLLFEKLWRNLFIVEGLLTICTSFSSANEIHK